MKVVILAAGRGTRMEEFTQNTTKAMLIIKDQNNIKKPMLQITMEKCVECGLKEFIFVVGYRKEDIYKHFGDGSKWGVNINYVTQPNIKAGTADAVRWTKEYLKNEKEFLLIYGDIVPSKEDLENLISGVSGGSNNVRGVMAVRTVENPERYGVVETKGCVITRIIEKSKNPPTNLANAGIYVLPFPEIFEEISKTALSERGEFELTDSIQQVIDRGLIIKWQKISNVKDIGTKKEYLQIK
jgi:bifunctional UDP-N-acetylglucosamine pyrophosphorylase/glucosamine-1-phosphate N-acetyltransferase